MITNSDELCDAALIMKAKQGDSDAISQLLWHSYDHLLLHIRPLIPRSIQSSIDVEDVIQDTFAVVWKNIGSLRETDPTAFQVWIRTIAKRKLFDRLRARKRQKRGGHLRQTDYLTSDQSSGVPLLQVLANEDRSPSSHAAANEAETELRCAMVGLSDRYRRAISLRYLKGFSVAKVADEMECTERAVHMLCHRGLKHLRKRMGNPSRFFDK